MLNTVLSSILGVGGLAIFALGVYLKKRNVASTASFTQIVNAKVVALKDAGPFDRGKKVLFPTLRYTYKGKVYRTNCKEFVNGNVNIGDTFSIFIDPDSPANLCLVKGGDTIGSLATKGFGALMLLGSLLVLLLME